MEKIDSSLRTIGLPKIIKYIHKGIELGHVNDLVFGKTKSRQDNSHFGLMTNNIVTRKEAYRESLISVLTRSPHLELFED